MWPDDIVDVWPLCANRMSVITTILDRLIAFGKVMHRPRDCQICGLIANVWKPKCVTRRIEHAYLAAYRKSDTQTNDVAGMSTDVQATKAAWCAGQCKYCGFVHQAYCILVQHSLI